MVHYECRFMGIDKSELQGIMVGSEADRVKALCQLLGYPLHERDPNSKKFWYLHPGNNIDEARDTAPIAIAFYDELVGSDANIKQFLISKEQHQVIYKHYIEATEPPVMYILLPLAGDVKRERVALILPTVGKIRQRCINTFGWQDDELRGRLSRLQWEALADKIWKNPLGFVPQVDWIFYKSANTAKELAVLLAEVTRRIEQMIPLIYESEGEAGYLHKLLDSFRKELLPNLQVSSQNEKDYSFADIYAQTMAYGLFTARVFSFVKEPKSDFSREGIWEKLPETNPFLRQLFKDISEQKAEQIGDDLIDAIAEIVSIL